MVRRAADIVLLGAVRERVADKTDLQIVPSARQCNLTWCDVFLFLFFPPSGLPPLVFFFFLCKCGRHNEEASGTICKTWTSPQKAHLGETSIYIFCSAMETASETEGFWTGRFTNTTFKDPVTAYWSPLIELSCSVMYDVHDHHVSWEDCSAPSGGHERDGGKGGCKSFTSAFLLPFLNQSSALGSDHKGSQTSSKCWLRSPSHLNPNNNVSLNSDNLFPCVKCNLKQGRTKWYTFQTNC